MADGVIPMRVNSRAGVEGSMITVSHEQLEKGPHAGREIDREIRIHTVGNSVIPRRDFPKWSRWYQEDGNTQVMRLFKDEENVRNPRTQAARIEAFSNHRWKRGDPWQEWVGTYTIVKPHEASIFQVFNNVNQWAVHLGMNDKGDISLKPRRHQPKKILARNMTGKSFHIKVRDNGHDYEVYFNGELVGSGYYDRPEGETQFRWGMYVGANDIRHDAMIFVSGATMNPEPEVADAP